MRLSVLLALASKVILSPPHTRWHPVGVDPISDEDWHLFCGDKVQILEGKDAGKQGKVVQVSRQRNWVVLEGLNTHFRYIGKKKDSLGTKIPSEAPLLHSQVKLVDPVDRKPTKIESERIILKPEFPRADGIVPETWIDGHKDISVEDAMERTYVPGLKTLEEEVMEAMGIQETWKHKKVYWY
ncbi:hypothetical protein H1C71_020945 [Ictidomys tridecemlineatus]|uniref:Large ribosomal subunit protein uL24m n=1 Tax=Ictidomys tridecemlineatus TaxID=43179 RepID=I3NBD3_ICTTR|nr:hypothetical protein H1C71_020945 [Ictidomys tridecemlineatus]